MPRRSGSVVGLVALAAAGCALPGGLGAGRPVGDPGVVRAGFESSAVPVTPGPGPEAIRCLAARHSTAANLLELRRRAVESDPPRRLDRGAGPVWVLRRELLELAALEARNRSAGAALELYHQLAGVEARRELLRLGIADADAALAKAGAIKGSGLAPGRVDEEALRRRRLDLDHDGLELRLARDRLRGELQGLVRLDPGTWPIPPTPASVGPGPAIDPRAAVAVGLARRPDLRLLRRLRSSLDAGALPAARLVLARADPLLAAGPARSLCRLGRGDGAELGAVRRQLDLLLADREQAAAGEIARAAGAVQVRSAQVEVARGQVRSWEADVERAEGRERRGIASFAAALPARAGLLKAREALVGREVDREVAGVLLTKAQGLMAKGCGGCGPAQPPAPAPAPAPPPSMIRP